MTNNDNSKLIFRDMEKKYPYIESGDGIYLYDENGKRYIDGTSGSAAVSNIGHGVPEVIQAIEDQVKKYAYCPSHYFANRPAVELAGLIAQISPQGMSKVWLVTDGSEATENAVKLARQYQLECGRASKHLVITRWQSYHGATLGALGYGGNAGRRKKYLPMLQNSPHIPPAYCYRCYFEKVHPECGLLCASALEKEIKQQGPENVAAFIAEPVVGATLGAAPAPEGYFQKIREICDRYDVVFISDEVMTGFGRTGEMFGITNWNVTPDIMACAKGISGGYVPLGAVVVHEKIWDALKDNRSNFVSGHTYSAHHLIAAAARAAVLYLLDHDLVSRAKEQGRYFLGQLDKLAASRWVGDIRGRGLFAGIELVQDKKTGRPFPLDALISERFGAEALERGLITYPGKGCADGIAGDHILLAPPLVIRQEEIDEIVSILGDVLEVLEKQAGG